MDSALVFGTKGSWFESRADRVIFEQIFGSKYIEKLLGIVHFSVLFEICSTRCIVSVCLGSKRYQKRKP